jgi:hypothetical protein
MLRDEIDYGEFCRRGRQRGKAHAEKPARERGQRKRRP